MLLGFGQAVQGPLSPVQYIDYEACMWQCSGTATDEECDTFCRGTAIGLPSGSVTPATTPPAPKATGQLIPGVDNKYLLIAAAIIGGVLIVR